MRNHLTLTAEKVQKVVQQKGSIALSDLESEVDASYNLLFLALDQMAAESRIRIRKFGRDYMISRVSAPHAPDLPFPSAQPSSRSSCLTGGDFGVEALPFSEEAGRLDGDFECLAQDVE
jgi:hypothetical protein